MYCLPVSLIYQHTPTFLDKKSRFALLVADRKRLDDPVNLLSLVWEGHLHEQLAQSDIQRVMSKVEAVHVDPQSFDEEVIRAVMSIPSTTRATHLAARTFAISRLWIVVAVRVNHSSGASSPSRTIARLMSMLSSAETLPMLRRGFAPSSSVPGTPEETRPVDRGGSGNSGDGPFGDGGPEPKMPLENL